MTAQRGAPGAKAKRRVRRAYMLRLDSARCLHMAARGHDVNSSNDWKNARAWFPMIGSLRAAFRDGAERRLVSRGGGEVRCEHEGDYMLSATNGVVTNAAAAASTNAVALGGASPAGHSFDMTDGVEIAIVLLLLPFVLRGCLRLLARDEADDSILKSLIATLLVLLPGATVASMGLSLPQQCVAGIFAFLTGSLVMGEFYGLNYKKALLVMLIMTLAGGGLVGGVGWVSNWILHQNRVTLAKKIEMSQAAAREAAAQSRDAAVASNAAGIVSTGQVQQAQAGAAGQAASQVHGPVAASNAPGPAAAGPAQAAQAAVAGQPAGQKREPMAASNTVGNMKAGVALEAQAIVGAVQLLKNPNAIKEMTAEHQADLKAMGLITDGKAPPPEVLKELAATADDTGRDREAFRRASRGEALSEQDVKDIANFIQKARHDKSEVKASDIAAVIYEARRQAGAKAGGTTAVVAAAAPRAATDAAGNVEIAQVPAAVASGAVPQASGANVAAPGVVIDAINPVPADAASAVAVPAVPVEVGASNPAAPLDPLASLPEAERAAWMDSHDSLHLAGVMINSKATTALVNGTMVRPGGVIRVESHGRTFTWRLVSATKYKAVWEPVLKQEDTSWLAPAASK